MSWCDFEDLKQGDVYTLKCKDSQTVLIAIDDCKFLYLYTSAVGEVVAYVEDKTCFNRNAFKRLHSGRKKS